jgi:flagellar basal-body rod protein FlgB
MLQGINKELGFFQNALDLRSMRQQLLASNIANADTPNYKAVDMDFGKELARVQGMQQGNLALKETAGNHLQPGKANPLNARAMYRTGVQPSIDGNTVDMDVERANFSDNAIHYEADIAFISAQLKTLIAAIQA